MSVDVQKMSSLIEWVLVTKKMELREWLKPLVMFSRGNLSLVTYMEQLEEFLCRFFYANPFLISMIRDHGFLILAWYMEKKL